MDTFPKYTHLLKYSVLIVIFILSVASPAQAYIGPGAGFAFLGSTFVFFITILLGIATVALWPIQWAFRKIRRLRSHRRASARRVIILGLDGLEPKLVDKFIAEGKLPNLKALQDQGTYQRLGTTLPALSPVAWSTFQTGVNPGAHNIFDFLTRDKRNYLPILASTKTDSFKKVLGIFGVGFTKVSQRVSITRKSTPFWKILGNHGIFSQILRVPISYPPEKFSGNILSAMCTPDIKGTQGSFSFFTTRKETHAGQEIGGQTVKVQRNGHEVKGFLEGPPDPANNGFLRVEFKIEIDESQQTCVLHLGKARQVLSLNQFSPWLEVEFTTGRRKISGICRFCVREISPEFSLYVSPINIHPEKPALPISHPLFFSSWIAKHQGLFGTLGLLEDTWGRNEHALDDARFLEQAYLVHEEREQMFLNALERTNEGLCACVFDASDRIQHMFWRYLDPQHPSSLEDPDKFSQVIPDMYQRMDALVGKTNAKIKNEDLFMVISDHGFSSFRRGVNINTWLLEQGLLYLKGSAKVGRDYFQDIDWSKTKAFALGLSGIYLNLQGREQFGIVDAADAAALKQQISSKLEQLRDPADGATCVSKVYDREREYKGLYVEEAPDLIVGYAPGYRVSWDSVTGTVEAEVFSNNTKAWSGDHHIDPSLVPGIFFSNRKFQTPGPSLLDIAPTVLNVFGLPIPSYMEGKVLSE